MGQLAKMTGGTDSAAIGVPQAHEAPTRLIAGGSVSTFSLLGFTSTICQGDGVCRIVASAV